MTTGSELEMQVKQLLSLQGWSVTSETIVGHKKIDCYAEKVGDFGKRRRLAIECKDYASALDKGDILNIWTDYSPLVETRQVEEVLLVTRCGLTAAAETFVSLTRGLEHIRFLELQNTLLDFSGYLSGLIANYKGSLVFSCYQPQRFADAAELEQVLTAETYLLTWIGSDDQLPIAILGSYGMGKSTLADRIAYLLAETFSVNPSGRIPIVIRLHRIAAEQTLEGLIAKQFTAITPVHNFNYHAFMELNRRGKFCILLDGFDEMAETMPWEMFRHNLSQLNRLVEGKAKVVIGGRPSAFLTRAEQVEALHGRRVTGTGDIRKVPGWPDYIEVHLLPFDRNELNTLVPAYALAVARRGGGRLEQKAIDRLVDILQSKSVTGERLMNLAERPVQLHMLLEVLPEWEADLDSLTISSLYSFFIDLIIERELNKAHTRQRFSVRERRSFARDLAWWMWQSGIVVAVEATQISSQVFAHFVRHDEGAEDVLRDLLSVCFLERRAGGFYFPHKSFQEFLIAEKIVALLLSGDVRSVFSRELTTEIRDFLVGILREGRRPKIFDVFRSLRGIIPDGLMDLLISSVPEPAALLESRNNNPWALAVLASGLAAERWKLDLDSERRLVSECLSSSHAYDIGVRAWSQYLVILACVLRERYVAVFDKNSYIKKILNLCENAHTIQWMQQNQKADTREVLIRHLANGFVAVDSWLRSGPFSPTREIFGHEEYLRTRSQRKSNTKE